MKTRISIRLAVLAALLAVAGSIHAQSSTLLGVEFGPKWDRYLLEDTNNVISTRPFFYAPYLGFTLSEDFNQQLRVETGFSVVNYGKSYRINGERNVGISSAIRSYQVPLRIKLRVNAGDGQFRVLPMFGYVFGFNLDYGSTGSTYSCVGPPCNGQSGDSTVTRATANYSLRRTFHLVQGGITFEYQVNDGPIFSLSGTFSAGLNRIVDLDISYWANGQPEAKAVAFATGANLNVNLGLAYPISRIWQGGMAPRERDWER